MTGFLVRGRVRIKIRMRVTGLGLRLTLGFTAGAIVAGVNAGHSIFTFFSNLLEKSKV